MHEMILCKLGEVVLKGLNRRSFEDKLMANVNLDGSEKIEAQHLAEAIQYRNTDILRG